MKKSDTMLRLNKYLSEIGFCSRREGDRLIDAGRVKVNGEVATIGVKVTENDDVMVDDVLVSRKEETYVYIALNKPKGITSTTDLTDKTNMVDFVNHPKRIFPIGRLDKDSEGIILLTSDGDIVNKILRSGNKHDKEYLVTVDKKITHEFLHKMRIGVPILDTVTKPAIVKQVSDTQFIIILIEGLNRQIRRMCTRLGYGVKRLERKRIMNITDKNLKRGTWRDLTKEELETLKSLVEDSSKTEEASK